MPAATWPPSRAAWAGPPGECDVAQLVGLYARRLADQAEQDVVGAAGRAAGHRNLAGVRLQRGDGVLGILDRGGGRHDDHEELAGQAGHGTVCVSFTGALFGDDCATITMPATYQRVRAPAPLVEELGQADHAAGAGDVRDLRRVDELVGAQHLLDRPRRLVPSAARGGRDEELQLVDGLGRGGPDAEGCRRGARKRQGSRSHVSSSMENHPPQHAHPGSDGPGQLHAF